MHSNYLDNQHKNTSFFDIEYRKNMRNYIAKSIHDVLIQTNVSSKTFAFMIKAWHFTFPYMTLFIYLFAPLWMCYTIILILLFFCGIFIYLKGCFVSSLEHMLDSENTTNIIDPYLELFNIEIANDTRYTATISIAFVYFIMTSVILYGRLKWNKYSHNNKSVNK